MNEAPVVFSPLGIVRVPEEYWQPRRMDSSKSSASAKSRKSKSSSASRSPTSAQMDRRVKKMFDRVIDELQYMNIEYFDTTHLPKLKRNPRFQKAYAKIYETFKKDVKLPVQKITQHKQLISTIHDTIQADLGAWLNALKMAGVRKGNLKMLKKFVEDTDAGELAETFEELKLKLAALFKIEYDTLAELKSKQLMAQQAHVHDDDLTLYNYFTKRLEDVSELLDEVREQRTVMLGEMNGLSGGVEESVALLVYAMEFVDKYQTAITKYEEAKEEQKGALDDLVALFGKM